MVGLHPRSPLLWVGFLLVSLISPLAAAEGEQEPVPADDDAVAEEAATQPEQQEDAQRTELNLLGEVDDAAGESRRNENVQIDLIDNNVLKEINLRVGVTATVVEEFKPSQGYFGTEFGGQPSAPIVLSHSANDAIHGSAFWSHDNSIFRARSFFQVGDVQPARTNDYGFNLALPLGSRTTLDLNGSQSKARGQVNGNVLVPRPDERTPLATDPALRAKVQRVLDSYPTEAPNRTDIDQRALNTNAPQEIDNSTAGAGLYRVFGDDDRLAARYRFTSQKVEAFQLVSGQNPDVRTKSHDARLTWTRTFSPETAMDLSVAFDRVGSNLFPDESAFGEFIITGFVIQSLGPGSNIPIDRAQNRFRYSGGVDHIRGKHTLSAGGELWRVQVNGSETNTHRGLFSFRNDFGNDAITNIRLGTPSSYLTALGDPHRGFRQWRTHLWAGDVWRPNTKWTLNFGLRYEPVGAPSEINGLSEIPYGCDCNNFAPSFGLAYRPSDRWGVIRASYGVHYGEVFAVTYGNSRFNPPNTIRLQLQKPDFLDPLGDFDPGEIDPNNTRATLFGISPELITPYEHQYNFRWELPLARDWRLHLGYVGSRSVKLLTLWYFNRGEPKEGVPQVTATVNARRADPRYFDVRRNLNGGRGYYDAARVSLIAPRRGGLSFETSYWFSKAIDLGSDYTNTAAGADARNGRGQSQFDVHGDMKGVSAFHQPHAWMTRLTYQTPSLLGGSRWMRTLLGSWEAFAVVLLKTGTPFTVIAGSDGPGFGNVDGSGADRVNIDRPEILGRTIDDPDTSRELLPDDAFSFIQPTDRRGNIGRNTFRKDSIQNINFALSRTWAFASDLRMTLRAESNNLLNHPQFAEPGAERTSPNFGRITNTLNDGRSFRFLLRLAF